MTKVEDSSVVRCSFRARRRRTFTHHRGAGVNICNECVELCREIIEEDVEADNPST
jgi:ATP-dependent protease Clp ATPase subunit